MGFRGRSQGYCGFGGEIEEGKRFLQIQANVGFSVIQVADGDVLANVKIEVATASRDDESPVNGGRPDDFVFD